MNKLAGSAGVGVRTKEGSAIYVKDFIQLDEKLQFKNGEEHKIIKVQVIDDDNWAEDREFTVELYNIITNEAFTEIDTTTHVLIIDDDKPGNLAFSQKKGQVRHVATNPVCEVEVSRTGGADGVISCKYKTFQLKSSARSAEPGTHFNVTEGVLEMKHAETKFKIQIPIICEDPDSSNGMMFGVKLSDVQPRVCKIKRDTLIVELVADQK